VPPDESTLPLLPIEIQVGDRFNDQDFEWEVLTHPASLHGGKKSAGEDLAAGSPRERSENHAAAHERVTIRRTR
jgi:hypothetical protein